MRCTSPLYRVNNSYRVENGFPPLKNKVYGYNAWDYFVNQKGYSSQYFTEIPCGQCINCRINYASQWAERCYLESLNFDVNCFITLTYDDEHLPLSSKGFPTLRKRDVQLFFKRLRKYVDFRYYCSGEYGDSTYRPHYHICFFGFEPDDCVFYKWNRSNKSVYPLFNSSFIDKIWKKGFATISRCCAETMSYCAQYSLKKFKTNFKFANHFLDKKYLSNLEEITKRQLHGDIEKIFSLMSRRPAIGRWKYDKDKYEIYANDVIPDIKVHRLRYFDKLFEVDEPELYKEVKLRRESNSPNPKPVKRDLNLSEYNKKVLEDALARINARVKI